MFFFNLMFMGSWLSPSDFCSWYFESRFLKTLFPPKSFALENENQSLQISASKRYKKDKKWYQQHWCVCVYVCVCVCVLGEADESERCSFLPYGTWAYITENHVRTKRSQTKLKFQNRLFWSEWRVLKIKLLFFCKFIIKISLNMHSKLTEMTVFYVFIIMHSNF